MNSQVEARFRDSDDARRKLVSLTSGVGFRLLVKQALAPGEPLQIDIGDGNLLVLACYRLPVESGYSFGVARTVARTNDWQPEDTAIPSEKAPAQDANCQQGRPQRRGLLFGGIAVAAIGLSALGILWGGMRKIGQASAPLAAFVKQTAGIERTETTKRTAENKATNSVEPPAIAASEPQQEARGGLTASSFQDRKVADGASIPASPSKGLPVRVNAIAPKTAPDKRIDLIAGIVPSPQHAGVVAASNAIALKTAPDKRSDPKVGIVPSIQHAEVVTVSNSPASSVTGSAHSISIKASSASWVTACADGVRVFAKLFNTGDVGEVRFSREATLRSGNAAALELVVGKQAIGPMGAWGQVRTIKVTPAGYEFATAAPASNCGETSPKN
jgi:hypothetical protein